MLLSSGQPDKNQCSTTQLHKIMATVISKRLEIIRIESTLYSYMSEPKFFTSLPFIGFHNK